MKNLILSILILALTLTGCSSAVEAPQVRETVTVQALNADRVLTDVEVPFDPGRIAVLDMAALDLLDSLGLGERIVGSAGVSIAYLKDYDPDGSDGKIRDLGSVKTADLEQVALCEPDIIFIGGRLSEMYAQLEAIAPVVCLGVDYDKGVVTGTADNLRTVAKIFGLEADAEALMGGFRGRIEALREVLAGKELLLTLYNNNALSILDTRSQLNILASELGGINLGQKMDQGTTAAHGEEASWETIVELDPEYIFVLDRSTATGAAEQGAPGAREVIENDLIRELDCFKAGRIVYFIENANVWYTATGGLQALDTMLTDLETALLG